MKYRFFLLPLVVLLSMASLSAQNTGSAYLKYPPTRIRVADDAPVNPAANPAAYVITGNTITVEAWVFPTELPPHGSKNPIVCRPYWAQEPFFAYELCISNQDETDNPKFEFVVTDGNVPMNPGKATGTSTAEAGVWTHLAGTYDGSAVLLYINGNLVDEQPYMANIGEGNTGFFIGQNASHYYQGLIDEVRLWNLARTQIEIQENMSTTLLGNEPGLVGYWPLNEATEVNGNWPVTVDLTANHNDLWVLNETEFVTATPDSVVSIAPEFRVESLEGVVDEYFEYHLVVCGWPLPEVSLISGPGGMTYLPDPGRVEWIPAQGQEDYQFFTLQAASSAGTTDATYAVWVDPLHWEWATHNTNSITLSIFNNGHLGRRLLADTLGFLFDGLNGLYDGTFMVAQSDSQVSGGLYINEYGVGDVIIQYVDNDVTWADQSFETSFNDRRAPDPIGVRVVQRSHSKSTEPDDDFVVMEYEVNNESEEDLYGLYLGIAMDWDIGHHADDLGGYDDTRRLSYMYSAGEVDNPNYYGVVPLHGGVSGMTFWQIGGSADYDDGPLYHAMTTFSSTPEIPGDYRAVIAYGPFDIPAGGSALAPFAILGGSTLADLQANADAAKVLYGLGLSAGHTWGAPGDTVTIDVSLSNPEHELIQALEFDIKFDSTLITLIDVTTDPSTLLNQSGWLFESYLSGDSLSIAAAGDTGLVGSGPLFYVTFALSAIALDEAVSPLTFTNILFNDGFPSAYSIRDGFIQAIIAGGDVDLNGEVHAFDASLILQYVSERIGFTIQQELEAEVSGSGIISALDASLVLQHVVGSVSTFPSQGGPPPPIASGSLALDEQILALGEEIAVPIYLVDGSSVFSGSFTMLYDTENLNFIEARTTEATEGFLTSCKGENGEVTLFLAGASGIESSQPLLEAVFSTLISENTVSEVVLSAAQLNENLVWDRGDTSQIDFLIDVQENYAVPAAYLLHQNYPNPFNPVSTIRYDLPEAGKVSLIVYDMLGREVARLVDSHMVPGYHQAQWAGKNHYGRGVPTGIYIARLVTPAYSKSIKMLLLK